MVVDPGTGMESVEWPAGVVRGEGGSWYAPGGAVERKGGTLDAAPGELRLRLLLPLLLLSPAVRGMSIYLRGSE